jgi:hypothetical protein
MAKVSTNSFTVMVDGADWKPNAYLYYPKLVDGELTATDVATGENGPVWKSGFVWTVSGKVATATFTNSRYSNLKGTIKFSSVLLNDGGLDTTDGGWAPPDGSTIYVGKPVEGITF